MDDAINTAAGATTPQDAPIVAEAPVVLLPYAIPVGMTPPQAQARVDELMKNPDFAAAYFKGGMDSREYKELDALQRLAARMEQPAPPEVKLPDVEQPPANLAEYRLHEPHLQQQLDDNGRQQLDELREVAAGAALPASWFQSISHQAALDSGRYAGWTDDQVGDYADAELHRVFGDRYDAAHEGARAVAWEIEQRHPGTLEKIQKAGLSRNLSLLSYLMQKGLEKASRK